MYRKIKVYFFYKANRIYNKSILSSLQTEILLNYHNQSVP